MKKIFTTLMLALTGICAAFGFDYIYAFTNDLPHPVNITIYSTNSSGYSFTPPVRVEAHTNFTYTHESANGAGLYLTNANPIRMWITKPVSAFHISANAASDFFGTNFSIIGFPRKILLSSNAPGVQDSSGIRTTNAPGFNNASRSWSTNSPFIPVVVTLTVRSNLLVWSWNPTNDSPKGWAIQAAGDLNGNFGDEVFVPAATNQWTIPDADPTYWRVLGYGDTNETTISTRPSNVVLK